MKKIFPVIIALLAWIGLALHFANTLANASNNGVALLEGTARFFSFFTVVSNLIVAITMSLITFAPGHKLTRFVNTSSVLTATAVYITIVAVVYSLFLRGVVKLVGMRIISDHIVHDIVPPLFVIYWGLYAPKNNLKWSEPFKWLIIPVLYIAFCLIHGAIDNWYPYWFADVAKLGYPVALRNAFLVLIAFVIFGYILAAVAKLLTASKSPPQDRRLRAETDK